MLHEYIESRCRGQDLIILNVAKDRHRSKIEECCEVVCESMFDIRMRVCAILSTFLWWKDKSRLCAVIAFLILFVLSTSVTHPP